eukprot:COSAG01_NODE_61736_length_288_cov_0.783069_1_plen_43_part_10
MACAIATVRTRAALQTTPDQMMRLHGFHDLHGYHWVPVAIAVA